MHMLCAAQLPTPRWGGLDILEPGAAERILRGSKTWN